MHLLPLIFLVLFSFGKDFLLFFLEFSVKIYSFFLCIVLPILAGCLLVPDSVPGSLRLDSFLMCFSGGVLLGPALP